MAVGKKEGRQKNWNSPGKNSRREKQTYESKAKARTMKNVEKGTNMLAAERQQEKMKRWNGDDGGKEERKSLHQSEKMKA